MGTAGVPHVKPRVRTRGFVSASLAAALVLSLALFGCRGSSRPTSPDSVPPLNAQADPGLNPPETLVGAGDIAVCGSSGAVETARLLDAIPGTVFTAGDNTYPSGTEQSFRDCYGTTWGRHRWRTRPSPGNHDYDVPGALPYFAYFGAQAGDTRGYYSYRLGEWLVLSLNSNVPSGDGSAQLEWARAELASYGSKCALAYWHHPVITSGPHGDNRHMQPMWRLMRQARVEIVISGHDHLYERFAPMDGEFRSDPGAGVRMFIAGTGGARPYEPVSIRPVSEVRASVWGVLKLVLRSDGYDWEFVSVPGVSFSDAGSANCH